MTYNLAKVSIKNKVKKFIFISTDKAVNPKSVMGYSKSFCEKLLIDLNNKHNLKNVFKIVRFRLLFELQFQVFSELNLFPQTCKK